MSGFQSQSGDLDRTFLSNKDFLDRYSDKAPRPVVWGVGRMYGDASYPFTAMLGWSVDALYSSDTYIISNLTARSTPVQVGGQFSITKNSWTMVAGGTGVSAAIRDDGTLWTWGVGREGGGSLGIGYMSNYTSPGPKTETGYQYYQRVSPVQVGTSSWSMVATTCVRDTFNSSDYAFDIMLAIRSDGKLFRWGWGVGSAPVQVGASNWTSVVTSSDMMWAIRSDGGLFGWSSWNYAAGNGQLGNNSTALVQSPVQVGTSSWISVAASPYHTVAIRSDGGLFAWGYGRYLGQDNTIDRSSPVQIGTSSWSSVAAGTSFCFAIRSDGALFSWGDNTYGQLGLGDTISRSSPVQIGTSSWTAVSGGDSHAAAIRVDGTVFAWGNNAYGQLSQNNRIAYSSPVQLRSGDASAGKDDKYLASRVSCGFGKTFLVGMKR